MAPLRPMSWPGGPTFSTSLGRSAGNGNRPAQAASSTCLVDPRGKLSPDIAAIAHIHAGRPEFVTGLPEEL